jgi:hypothetical protein
MMTSVMSSAAIGQMLRVPWREIPNASALFDQL